MAILSDEELRDALAGRRHWRRAGDTLVRERALRDFAEALAFLERIGEAVEDYGRHPDIAITGGNRVRVIVTNANGAGFTDAELRLVAKVDEVADAPLAKPEPERGPIAAVVASVVSSAAAPDGATAEAVAPGADAERDTGRRNRAAVLAAAAGGVVAGAASVLATRRR
jgi:pterin-4a-carbinolamine dehydratase